MNAYIVRPKDLRVCTSIEGGESPLAFTANPVRASKLPHGLVSVNGKVYNSLPDGLPILVSYSDGGMEILENYSPEIIAYSKFIVSGSMILLRKGQLVTPKSSLITLGNDVIDRIGIATLPDGNIFVVHRKCTTEVLQATLHAYGAYDAMMGAYGDVYFYNPRGGVNVGTRPVTTLQAKAYKELPHPIVVIDPGHGGYDPGATGNGLQEKTLNLNGAKIIQDYLNENYVGTFVLTRDTDSTLSLKERTDAANALGADFFLSVHSNAYNGKAYGYESFVYTSVSDTTKKIREAIHNEAMRALAPYGVTDRGKKAQNLHVLRTTKCPAVLVEVLFIDNPEEAKLLKNTAIMRDVYVAHAKGIASGLQLSKKAKTQEALPVDGALYKVQTGAYRFRAGAEEHLERLRKAGFDGFITRQ